MLTAHVRRVASVPLLLSVASIVLGRQAAAQDFNVKVGIAPVPSSDFGAASGQTGPWNLVAMRAGDVALVDTSGRSTGAYARGEDCDWADCSACDPGECPGFAGDADQSALLTSWGSGDCIADLNVSVHKLVPGSYQMHVYLYNGCGPSTVSDVELRVRDAGGDDVHQSSFQLGGVTFQGTWAGFPVGAEMFVIAPGDYVRVRWSTPYGGGLCGLQLHRLDGEAGPRFCPGDGSVAACPCANDGGTGRGCENSASTGGAALVASGEASLSTDTVTFTSAWEMPSALTVFFQGSASVGPFLFGDGLRCVGGSLKRLYSKSASFGFASAPGPADPSVSVRSAALGDPIPNGATRYYQAYYRDPNPAHCPLPTGSTFNASSGVVLVWGG